MRGRKPHIEPRTPFARRLRAAVQAKGMSDIGVADELGVGQSRFANYAAGTREPDFDMLARICRILETTPNELLGWEKSVADSPGRLVAVLPQVRNPEEQAMLNVFRDLDGDARKAWTELMRGFTDKAKARGAAKAPAVKRATHR